MRSITCWRTKAIDLEAEHRIFGDPFIAVAATPTDIGAYELQSLGDVIFAGGFDRRREICVRAPGPDLSWRLSFPVRLTRP